MSRKFACCSFKWKRKRRLTEHFVKYLAVVVYVLSRKSWPIFLARLIRMANLSVTTRFSEWESGLLLANHSGIFTNNFLSRFMGYGSASQPSLSAAESITQ